MKSSIGWIVITMILACSAYADPIYAPEEISLLLNSAKSFKPCRMERLFGGLLEYLCVTENGTYVKVKPFRIPTGNGTQLIISTGNKIEHGKLAAQYTTKCERSSDLEQQLLELIKKTINNGDLTSREQQCLDVLSAQISHRELFPPKIELTNRVTEIFPRFKEASQIQ